MTDAIEVKPRYVDPPYSTIHEHAPPQTASIHEPPKVPNDCAPSRGIFVSMYENRVIILIIVVVITIVIIVAYFMHKGTDTTETTPKPQTKPIIEQVTQSPPPTSAQAVATPALPATPTRITRESLANLLTRSRQAEHRAMAAPTTTQNNTRSEEEIMQLMEAVPYRTGMEHDGATAPRDQATSSTEAVAPSGQTVPMPNNTEAPIDTPTDTEDPQPTNTNELAHGSGEEPHNSITKGDTCYMMLATGRRCRNRAQVQGGMCARHAH